MTAAPPPPIVAVHRIAAREDGVLVGMSDDGRKVAITRYVHGNRYRVGVLDVATGRRRTVATGDGAPWAPALSPDGRWVMSVRRRSLFVTPSGGGRARRLAHVYTSTLTWLRGNRIAAQLARGTLTAVSLDGSRTVLARGVSADAVVSPDGRYVLDAERCRIRLIDRAKGTSSIVGRTVAGAWWAPDSRHYTLSFGRWQDGCRHFDTYPSGGFVVRDVRAGRVAIMSRGFPTWSTDSRRLLVVGGIWGTAVTYAQPLDVFDVATGRVKHFVLPNRVWDALAGPSGEIVFGRYDIDADGDPAAGPTAPIRLYAGRLRR